MPLVLLIRRMVPEIGQRRFEALTASGIFAEARLRGGLVYIIQGMGDMIVVFCQVGGEIAQVLQRLRQGAGLVVEQFLQFGRSLARFATMVLKLFLVRGSNMLPTTSITNPGR